jgi:tripartite-type tricarboxylate transporter receptor subunit TctC
MLRRLTLVAACIAAAAAVFPGAVSAQSDYPNKPLRLIVPFPPGGSTDIIGRIVAQRLGEKLGQQIVVDNRGGAGGTIGTDAAAKAAPDGYTLAVGTTSTHAVAPGAYSKLGYDPVKDFAPVSLVAVTPYLLVVNAQVPAKSLKEFVTLAKSQPGKLNYASAGAGSTTHLAMEMLKDVAAINVVHIPYKGNGPAEVAVLAGEVQAIFGSMPALLQQVKANRLRPLAVGTARRSPAVPDVPTVAELGYPGFEAALWLGIVAPAGTPARAIERLARELNGIVATPAFREAMDKNGAEPVSNTPEQFATLIRQEADRYGKVVKALGIKLD